jgi:hypothetical protein
VGGAAATQSRKKVVVEGKKMVVEAGSGVRCRS